jgi:hypothetical protein
MIEEVGTPSRDAAGTSVIPLIARTAVSEFSGISNKPLLTMVVRSGLRVAGAGGFEPPIHGFKVL